MGLGSSGVVENFPYEKNKGSGEENMDTNLLSRVMHELVVRTAENSPVTGECWMGDDEVARRVGIGVSYFRVMNADSVRWCRLDECR